MSTVHEGTSGTLGQMSRRDLIRLGLLGALGLFLLETLGTFLVFFWPRKIGVFGSKVTIGTPDQFALASITTFQQAKMFVSHVPEGFLALYWKCPHLGCTVQWHPEEQTEDTLAQSGRFHCPCHGSIYDRHGQIISGPAPRPMDTFQLTVEAGKLVADTSIVNQRAHWQPDQAVKA